MKIVLMFIFSLMLLFSCEDDSTSPVVVKLDSLSGTEWLFDSFVDNDGSKHFLTNYTNREYSLNFHSDSADGRSGCNSYWFDYYVIKDSLFTGTFITTEVACELTQEYSEALNKSKQFYATKEVLVLYTTDTLMTKMNFKRK